MIYEVFMNQKYAGRATRNEVDNMLMQTTNSLPKCTGFVSRIVPAKDVMQGFDYLEVFQIYLN